MIFASRNVTFFLHYIIEFNRINVVDFEGFARRFDDEISLLFVCFLQRFRKVEHNVRRVESVYGISKSHEVEIVGIRQILKAFSHVVQRGFDSEFFKLVLIYIARFFGVSRSRKNVNYRIFHILTSFGSVLRVSRNVVLVVVIGRILAFCVGIVPDLSVKRHKF